MSDRGLHVDFLLQAGRLLLEYNESTGAIHRALQRTARALTGEACHVAVAYRTVTVSVGTAGTAFESVQELRYNMAVQARVHEVLDKVRRGRLDVPSALERLRHVEASTPRHGRVVAALLLGVAAAALARLLGADGAAAAVVGLASGLGLLVRQELGRRHFCFLALPLTAALIGAVLGAVAIRLGWTQSPELALIVPALMLVPGPHLINGLFDLIDNYLPMSLARLGLAMGVLLASALGVVLGLKLVLPYPSFPERGSDSDHLSLVSDVVLAGVVTCGFSVFYNTPWRRLGMAMVGGMAGHGLRYLALEAGWPLETATFLGGLAVGTISAWMACFSGTPVAVIAFAGAVTMIPGLSVYRALAGGLQLARLSAAADPRLLAATAGNALQACVVVSALALGLLLGARGVMAMAGERGSSKERRADHGGEEVARPTGADLGDRQVISERLAGRSAP